MFIVEKTTKSFAVVAQGFRRPKTNRKMRFF